MFCGSEANAIAGSAHEIAVTKETLHMLGAVLRLAFRLHCTRETVADRGAWELIREVQRKLVDLSQRPDSLVSEERLEEYLEATLSSSINGSEAITPLADAA